VQGWGDRQGPNTDPVWLSWWLGARRSWFRPRAGPGRPAHSADMSFPLSAFSTALSTAKDANHANEDRARQPQARFDGFRRLDRNSANCRTSRRVSFTASAVGNASATSGASNTRFVPSRYRRAYFPCTPDFRSSLRSYSERRSSFLPFCGFLFHTVSGELTACFRRLTSAFSGSHSNSSIALYCL
jgi:hypothetical protein